ncbi:MAG TPA: tautomerase family protein [Solirubrobacterales bacterium]|nr:tautomerase family protein [Solirubrobacterales bacterium]
MPRLDLTISADVLSEEAKPELMRKLGAALLRWEGAPDTEFFRSITWSHLHELPAEAIQTPDGVAEPHAMLDITIPSGALSDRRKAGIVEDATKLVLDATGWGKEAGVRIWVLIHEVPDGNWGAAGQVVRFEQLREAAKAERDQEGTGKEKVPAVADDDRVPA